MKKKIQFIYINHNSEPCYHESKYKAINNKNCVQ